MDSDDGEGHSLRILKDAFGDKTIYEILEVGVKATGEEIKKAYRKLALRYHPDKGGDVKLFQALSIAHSILSDDDKRKQYDDTGSVSVDESSNDFNSWYEYFRTLFPKVKVSDIESFGKKYKDSDEEKNDIISAYIKYDGDFNKLMETVILAEQEDVGRICEIIHRSIRTGELETTKLYTKTSQAALKRVEKENRPGGRPNKKARREAKGGEESLLELIRNKNNSTGGSSSSKTMDSILRKYGKEESDSSDIPDDEFAALQSKIVEKAGRPRPLRR